MWEIIGSWPGIRAGGGGKEGHHESSEALSGMPDPRAWPSTPAGATGEEIVLLCRFQQLTRDRRGEGDVVPEGDRVAHVAEVVRRCHEVPAGNGFPIVRLRLESVEALQPHRLL